MNTEVMGKVAVELGDCPLPVAASIARGLLQIGAVVLRPNDLFTWSSGWKSPIYCDNRLILSYPTLRDQVLRGFEAVMREYFAGTDLVAGTATAGIPHAAMLADRLGLRMGYVRSSAKGHGMQKRVEGRVYPGATAVVVEDTLSTGASAYDAVAALQADGVHVLGVLSVFSYDFEAVKKRVQETGVRAYRLVDYDALLLAAVELGAVSTADEDGLRAWREHPESYGQ
nr:orotate phosphoribosyltransferase [Alicyclobacillus sp. ALC3]